MLPSTVPIAQKDSSKNDTTPNASNFEQKAKALNNQFDEMDKSLRGATMQPISSSEKKKESEQQNSFTNLPKGLTLDDMSFWLRYRDEIDYSQPTPFSVPQQKKPIRAAKKKNQPLIEEIDEKTKNSTMTKLFCVKRKRNEEPLETFYIPSIQQAKKTKMSDLERQFATTSLNKNKTKDSFSMEPSFSLYKFTIVKKDGEENSKPVEKIKLSEQSSLKQVTNIKTKTTERTKAHESDMKKKRTLRINEMRNEGDKQVVELQVLSEQQTEKKDEKVDLSNYASMLDEIYGKGTTESLQTICENEFEVDYYTVETCEQDDIDSQNYEEQQNVLRFEKFDDQLWLESNLDERGIGQDDEYDSEDSNASGNPNNEYPDEEESDDEEEEDDHPQKSYNYNDIYGYPDDGEGEWEEDDDESMGDDFDY